MGEWEEWSSADEGDDFQLHVQPLARKKCTAAKSSEPAKLERFAEPATSAELEKLSASVILKNTQKNEQWALRAFNEWIQERNKRCEDKCPESILETENAESLAKWLSHCLPLRYARKMASVILLPLSTCCCVPCSASCTDATSSRLIKLLS